MEPVAETMEMDDLTCTETVIDDQSVDGGSSGEEDHPAGGPQVNGSGNGRSHQPRPKSGTGQRQRLLQKECSDIPPGGAAVGGKVDPHDVAMNQSNSRWRESDGADEMREDSPLEEDIDEVDESLANGEAVATANHVDQPEPAHLPGEYQFQLLPIHVQQRSDSRSGMFKVFKCDICAMVYRHVFSLKRHFLRCHINYKYLTTTDITNCGIHLQVIQAAQSNTTRNGDHLYRCHVCNQLFPQREQLRQHMTSHTTGKDKRSSNGVACSKCSSTFTDRKSLQRHQQLVHGATNSSNGSSQAIGAIQQVGNAAGGAPTSLAAGGAGSKKTMACRHCGKNFINNGDLRRHERLHETVDTTCRVCQRKFSQQEWVLHKTNTHPDVNHVCSYCDMLLPDVGALGQHLFQSHHKTYSENMRQINNKENGLSSHSTAQLSAGVAAANEKEAPSGVGSANDLETKPDRQLDTTVSCELCNKSFTSLVNLQRHNTVVHIKQVEKRLPHDQKTRALNSQRSPSEEEFYRTLGHRISENLQYHIDGRLPGSSQTGSTFEPERVEMNNCMPWLVNNFPPTLDITHIVQIYASRPPLATATNGPPAQHPISAGLIVPESTPPPGDEQIALGACLGLNPVVKHEVKREPRTVYICQVCGGTAASFGEIDEHKRNVHPNVVATHLELEGYTQAPPELLMQFGAGTKPNGVLGSASAPTPANPPGSVYRCTKCSRVFGRIPDLHAHIVQCGQLVNASLVPVRPASPRQITQRKFGPVLNTKRCDDSAVGLNGGDYGKDDPRRKRKFVERPQRRSARSTYNGGPSECAVCGQSFSSQASLRKHMMDECREEPNNRRRKDIKDKDSPTATPTPEPIKVSTGGFSEGWVDDYLDGKGPEQLQCRDCSATFPSLQLYKRHLSQCSCSASRPKTLLPVRSSGTSETAATGAAGAALASTARSSTLSNGAASMSRSQFEEMTMLGLARRAERDRQRDGDRRENGALLEDDDEDTKVYRCKTCQMGFGDYVKMLHHSMQEHGAPIPEVPESHEPRELAVQVQTSRQNGSYQANETLGNGQRVPINQGVSRRVNRRVYGSGMREEEVHEMDSGYPEKPGQLAIYDSEDLRDKERIAIEALSAICGASFFGSFGHNNSSSASSLNNNISNNNNNNDEVSNSKLVGRQSQPLMDHRY